ncbi:MAG: PQQ-binding-like beta-propeller repeat protein [Planctomycetota bacterium]
MNPKSTPPFAGIALLLFAASMANAQDWPQWNGPNRDGTTEQPVQPSFAKPASPLWSVKVGLGYSGPVISGDQLIVTDYVLQSGEITNNAGKRDKLTGKERIQCFHSETGEKLWDYSYDRPYSLSYPGGPRATPTIHDGRVYALGSEGDLLCHSLKTGKVIWQTSFNVDFGAKTPIWGHAASPLVYQDQLICMVGGEGSLVVSFDLASGEVIWKNLTSRDNETGYCPPTIVTAGGTDQLIIWDPTTVYSLNPKTGKTYWSEAVVPGYGMSILSPITDGELLFISGESRTSAMMRLASDTPAAELLWRGGPKDSLYLATSNAVFDGDHIYGADISSGALVCFEAESGTRKWQSAIPTNGSKRKRGEAHASAFLIDVGDTYLILSETGDLIHANLTPEGYQELDRFHAIDPTGKSMGRKVLWTYPAYANGSLYVRNDKELVCYKVAK